MASEQETVEVPQEQVEEVKPEATPKVEEVKPETTPEAAPKATPKAAPEEGAPAKVSTKEKVTGILSQTGDKIKGTVAGIKEKVTPAKK